MRWTPLVGQLLGLNKVVGLAAYIFRWMVCGFHRRIVTIRTG
jgi:hypothetical protein